jgi:hypothetical protein
VGSAGGRGGGDIGGPADKAGVKVLWAMVRLHSGRQRWSVAIANHGRSQWRRFGSTDEHAIISCRRNAERIARNVVHSILG